MAASVLLALVWLSLLINADRVPVIIDTDIGSDFDDCMAISYALSRNDVFDIKLILMATFNTTARAILTAKFLDTVNRSDVDVGIGLATPAGNRQGGVGPQWPWAEDYSLDDYPGNIYLDGISRAKEIIANASPTNPIYFVEIAPVPNVGIMFTDNPELKRNMRVIAMSGSIYKGYGGDHPSAEYNVAQNGSASRIMYNYTDSIPYAESMCVAPLDTTYYFQVYGNNYQNILNSKEAIPMTMIENYQVWYDNGGNGVGAYRPFNPSIGTSCMYDAQAMFQASILAVNTSNGIEAKCDEMPFMKMEGSRIIVNNSDYTVVDTYNSDNIQIVYESVEWNDGYENGTYPLGQFIANYLTNPK